MSLILKSTSRPSVVRENFCLRTTMDKLFESRIKTGDIEFLVDGELIPAHRCVLAALSPRYDAQFYGGLSESNIIKVQDVSASAFKEFLQFFYTTDVKLTIENIEDVIYLAQQSLVDDLVTECSNFLLYMVGLDNLIACYRLALVYGIEQLEEFCVKYIAANIKSVFKTDDFLNCDRDMLHHVLTIDSLDCDETEVFDACIEWARVKCEQDEIDANRIENLRDVLGDAFLKIRFCSMKFDEFEATKRRYSGLLTAQESIEVFNAIASKENCAMASASVFDDSNCKPRESQSMQSYLSCSFTHYSKMKMDSTSDRDFIAFYCDKSIQLNGFVLCNRITDNIESSVFIDGKEKARNIQKTISFTENETTITFDDPILIQHCAWCVICIKSKAFQPTNKRLNAFYTKKSVKEHGIQFRFLDYKSNNLNLITQLLFNVNNEPMYGYN